MRHVTLVAALCAAGLVGALATRIIEPTPRLPDAVPAPDADLRGIRDRLHRLERTVEELVELVGEIGRATPPPTPIRNAEPGKASLETPSSERAPAEPAPAPAHPEPDRDPDDPREIEDRGRRLAAFAEAAGRRRIERMSEELGLDEHQRTEITAILDRSRTAMSEVRRKLFAGGGRPDNPGEREQLRSEMRDLRESAELEIESILTPAQFEAFKRSDGRRGGPDGRRSR